MVGIAGVVDGDEDTTALFDGLSWLDDERTFTHRGDDVSVAVSLHEPFAGEQPVETTSGATVWIFGEVYGFEGDDGYVSRHETHPSATTAEYCAECYEEHGIDFVAGLNGEFAGVVHDREAEEISLFTDRLGTRGLFYATAADGATVFTTRLQSLPTYPALETDFDLEPLYEWFATDRALGVEVPLSGVEQVPPASVLGVDTVDGSVETDTYWRPVYDPVDRPLTDVVDEFMDLFREVMAERTADDVTYGLLLSGGSDSRAILAGSREPPACFTMAGWKNREASAAERCADIAGADWTLLERSVNYQIEALERNPPLSNFVGRFQHAHATGFVDELRDEVDVLMSGQFCDTFFKGHFLPVYEFPLDQISTIDVPVERRIDSVAEYVDATVDENPLPDYLETPPTLRAALEERISVAEDGVESHGVTYPSVRELVLSSEYFPLTNQPDSFFYDSLVQTMPYRSPFVDNRLIDLHLTIPRKYFLRRNLVDRLVGRLDPSLAAIPHSTTGVPLRYPYPVQYLGQKLSTLKRRFLPVDEPPESHLRQTSWTDHKTLIRERDFVEDRLAERADLLDACPFVDRDAVADVYQAHLAGEQRMPELYSLLTFLEMPVTRRLLSEEADV